MFENRCIYLRKPVFEDPQQKCVFTCETDLSEFGATPLVSNCGIPVVLNHEITLVTGCSHSRTHHYAKMLATAILNGGQYPFANCKLNSDNFRMMCLDCLGSFKDQCSLVVDLVIDAVRDFRPNFIVINDIDHLIPFAGHRDTNDFVAFLREITSLYNVAVCAIAHNLIGKVKNTTGLLGTELFGIATNIFRVIDHGATSTVTSYKAMVQTPYEFTFTLNDRNLPQEVVIAPQRVSASQDYIDTLTLQDIFSGIISEGDSVKPDELMSNVTSHLIRLAKFNRARFLISNALIRGIITRDPATGDYSATPVMREMPDPRTSCFLTGSDIHSQALLNHLQTGYYDRILTPDKNKPIVAFNTSPDPCT